MRVLVILARILPFALSFRRDHRRWLIGGRPASRSGDFHRRRAVALVAAIADLGPTFVKLAQVFAGRADLIPEPYVSALSSLTDQVPPVPLSAIERTIHESYGASVAELFDEFQPVPVAAASLGQVHRARYHGRDVAVKVLRPNVERQVARDVAAAQRIIAVAGRWITNPRLAGLSAVLDEFALRVSDEMDFRAEAENAERIRANFAADRRVLVPRIERELVRQRVLVMEFLEGQRIDRLEPWIAEGHFSAERVVATLIEVYIQMMLVDGLFHADPHPGNVLVAPDGKLILLDFGMVIPVPRDVRWHLISTVFASIKRDVDGVIAGFTALEVILPDADPLVVRELAQTLLDLAHTRTTATERIELVADEVMHTMYDFPVQLPRAMVYFARAAALIEGIGVRYDARFNAVLFAAPIALRLRKRILGSLREMPEPTADDWIWALGGVLGRVARIVSDAGEQLFAFLEEEFGAPARARRALRHTSSA